MHSSAESQKMNAFKFTYLDETARRQLLGVNDQFGSVPKGQSVTEEDDAPQVTLKDSNDPTLFHTPVLSFLQVLVVSVLKISKFTFSNQAKSEQCCVIVADGKTPLSFFFLPTERCNRSDGRQHLISHGSCLGVGL